jgi:hypothetical protein
MAKDSLESYIRRLASQDDANAKDATEYGGSWKESDSLFTGIDQIAVQNINQHDRIVIESTYASSCSFVGYGPMPKIPFSLCSQTLMPGSRCSGTSVGIPMPRLT